MLTWGDGDYSFAWLVPFVVVYLIWEKRQKLSAEPEEGAWWGIAPLLVGIAFFWLGELGGEYYTLYLSAWVMVIGSLWLGLGRNKIKVLAFPLCLILTTFPIPTFLYHKLSFELQLISSRIGTAMLQTAGVVAHREGNVIDIGATQLQVVQACSGLRYVFPLFVLGLIVAYFFRASIWKRAFVVFSTIPMTIFWNSMRIALTGILWINWGPKAAEGFLHDFSGFVIFLVSFAVLLGEIWVLRKIGNSAKVPPAVRPALPVEEDRGKKSISWQAYLPRVIVILVLLAANLICFQRIDFRQKIPIREPLSKFPMDIAEWRGAREFFGPEVMQSLTMSDYTLIEFHNETGRNINFYVAYFETQFKGGSIHSPETCLPGNGWVVKESATLTVPVKFGRDYLVVNRVVIEQLGKKMLGYFWFPQRGRNLTNIYQLKVYNFWDALIRKRTDGALIRVLTDMSAAESTDDAGARLNEFLNKALPILYPFIPGQELKN
jgi:exosortase D (VPLPA-CTERM-specific)